MGGRADTPAPVIALKGVSKIYGTGAAAVTALDRVDLTVEAGVFLAVMGPSGSGKSTCMNILGCLDSPSAGTYYFQGTDVSGLSRRDRAMIRRHFLGFVFQGFNLLHRTTALENVELPLVYQRVPGIERHKRAFEALAMVGLADRARHSPAELSGGQQQRVAIARAMVTNPAVVLADEPTGNLDSERSREIMTLLDHLNREQGVTIIMVTHEQAMAAYADRTVQFLDGRVAADRAGETP